MNEWTKRILWFVTWPVWAPVTLLAFAFVLILALPATLFGYFTEEYAKDDVYAEDDDE